MTDLVEYVRIEILVQIILIRTFFLYVVTDHFKLHTIMFLLTFVVKLHLGRLEIIDILLYCLILNEWNTKMQVLSLGIYRFKSYAYVKSRYLPIIQNLPRKNKDLNK